MTSALHSQLESLLLTEIPNETISKTAAATNAPFFLITGTMCPTVAFVKVSFERITL